MIEVLSPEEIEVLLERSVVGRIGCYAEGRIYVVPVAYAYDAGCVYAHTAEGLKLRMMRKNPSVCFEVDTVESVFNWRSVIAWGTFEELHGAAAEDAMRAIMLRFLQTKAQPNSRTLSSQRPGIASDQAVVYRIRLIEKMGRFEHTQE